MAAYPYVLVQEVPGAPISASPGVCYFCGSSQRQYQDERFPAYEPFIDLATSIDFEGFVYMCSTCLIEIGGLIGMVPQTDVAELKRTNRTLGRRNQILADKLQEAVGTIHTLSAPDPEPAE